MKKACDFSILDSSGPGPPCISMRRTEDMDPLVMSLASKHQRSKSAPDEKAALASWDIALKSLKEDMEPCNQKDPCKASKHRQQGLKRKDRLISLKQDVEHLQGMLKGQRATKGVLEQALGRASSVLIPVDGCNYLSQYTQSLIKEIALLELEVVQLEQHLLSMYRNAFQSKIKDQSCASKVLNKEEILSCQGNQSHELEAPKMAKKSGPSNFYTKSGSLVSKILNTPFGNRSYDESKSEHNEPKKGKPKSSFSQPIVFLKKETKGSPSPVTFELWHEVISAEANTSTNANEASSGVQSCDTPNKLSEELVRCMAAIYCKLAEPPISHFGASTSPPSSYSSSSTFSSRELFSDGWSPQSKMDPSSSISPTNSRQKKITAENMTPYTAMVAVHWIRVDDERLHYAEKMLQNFRSLVQELERVNPGKLKHDEKLAFWLNIYNALMMHAYLAYGIPHSQIKRVSLLQKASYKIGAHSVNAHTIEHTILGCKSHRPSQWIQALLSPVSKLKTSHKQVYALDRPEPLACFAICCGGLSDPAVRVYTAKNVYQELDVAKRDFLHANVVCQKDDKILAPRVLESFAKETSIGSSGLLEWICQNVSDDRRRDIRTCMSMRPHNKCIEWAPYNFTFRYVFVRDLARWFPPSSS